MVKAQHKKASSSGASRNPVKISAGEKVKEAKKKALKKKDDRKELIPHMPQFCDVYVGNVRPPPMGCCSPALIEYQVHSDLKESHLEELFSRCGVIDNVVISVASGVAVPTADIPPPYKVCGIRFGKRYEGTHYACVTFKDPVGACHALEMDGTELGGRPLIVSVFKNVYWVITHRCGCRCRSVWGRCLSISMPCKTSSNRPLILARRSRRR